MLLPTIAPVKRAELRCEPERLPSSKIGQRTHYDAAGRTAATDDPTIRGSKSLAGQRYRYDAKDQLPPVEDSRKGEVRGGRVASLRAKQRSTQRGTSNARPMHLQPSQAVTAKKKAACC